MSQLHGAWYGPWAMDRRFVNQQVEGAFVAAIRSIEQQSAAEVVVTVRHHSASYLHADLIVGALGGVATLGVMLFSPWPFSVQSIFVDPLLAGLVLGFAATQVPLLRRWLLSRRCRREAVRRLARSLFVDKGVGSTRGRTGILVHLSLLERMVEVVADDAVVTAVPPDVWRRAVDAVEAELRRGYDGSAVAGRIAALGGVLGRYLPRTADDVNELPDEVSES